MAKYEDFKKIMEEVGYTFVHDWYDSHGNGKHVTLQREFSVDDSGKQHKLCGTSDKVELIMVYVANNETVTGFRSEWSTNNYLLAKEIFEDQKEPKEFRKYERVGGRFVSPCGTASYENFKKKDWDPKFVTYWRVSSVAGHGQHAFRIKVDDLKSNEWAEYPAEENVN
jgi:hypothetical protein